MRLDRADQRHRDAAGSVDGIDVREVVLPEHDDAQLVAAGELVGSGPLDGEFGRFDARRAAGHCERSGKRQTDGMSTHHHRRTLQNLTVGLGQHG
ncbi:hypothetical protein BOS5A_200192 [Bosea sp. EC-HK365B]|nr:hypothetical protein BOS5A_200192 [Bosea sp. EC-HK365B]VXC93101.1 hypothetical protein BOSE127_80121 [Bosea sp. 127]